jgi:2-polyprenyl-3-methyl-5-hydroxy-6-metoxy-1,4-benzoquinol methylase
MALQQAGTAQPVDAYFASGATYWRDVYALAGTQAEIFRDRLAGALEWIEAVAAPRGSRALEVGCGAGFLATAMARRGYRVEAIDTSQAMVDVARQTAALAGVDGALHIDTGDANALDFPDASFDLVLAIALLPWLRRAEPAIAEMARVVKPGGHVILTADNQARLNTMLDPRYNLALAPLRERLKAVLVRLRLHHRSPFPSPTFHRRRFIDETLAAAGLVKVRSRTIGFGPFSLLGRMVVPEPVGTWLHHRLQGMADRGFPGLRASGGHYLVLSRKNG